MPIIARHHAQDAWRPLQAWPADCAVQWGGHGIVLGKAPYRTAFFEAFPAPGGFIRGEGATIEAAELDAYARFEKESACDHRWGRRGYLNGGAKCIRCGAFAVKFQSVEPLGQWRRPISDMEVSSIASGFILPKADDEPRTRKWRRGLHLRARQSGIAIPSDLSGFDDEDAFESFCHEAVIVWLMDRLAAGTSSSEHASSGIEALLSGLHINSLVREAKSRLETSNAA
ncbi:hypothetical protein [Bosea sp. RAC05]|uniref:hypothetical protein n=1 Tax=Bosea sp. RAC05 TaxID=1842539 RepID=UPI00083D628E|nr:hypothetical protein [Bosea sp. RAC05]AOG02875.1 hypothetical protein BSY19_5377 [Bosea sp. RAC05]